MANYAFRFSVIENVTAASRRINSAFGGMRFHARQFAAGLSDGYQEAMRLDSGLDQVARSKDRAFSGAGMRGFQSGITRSIGLVRQLTGVLALVGVGAAVKSATDLNDRLYTADALVAGITRSQESVNEAQRTATALSNKTGISYLNAYEGMSQMLTVTRGNVQQAGILTKTAAALAAIKPSEGFEGALFALKEIESGDTVSLRERFGFRVPTQKEAEKIAQRDGRSIQQVMFDSLQSQLDNSFGGGHKGQGVDFLLNIRANTIGGQLDRIRNSFSTIITPMVLPIMERFVGVLTRIGDWVAANGPRIEGMFNGVIATVSPLVESLMPAIGGMFNELYGLAVGLAPVFKSVFSGVAGAVSGLWPEIQPLLSGLARLIRAVLPILVKTWSMLWQVLRPAIVWLAQGLTWLANVLAGFFERNQSTIMRVVDFIGLWVRAIMGAAIFMVKFVWWIGSSIWSVVKWVGGMAKYAWVLHPFGWIGKVISEYLPGLKKALGGFWDWLKQGFLDLLNWIWDNFLKPVMDMFASLWDALGMSSATASAPNKPLDEAANRAEDETGRATYERQQQGLLAKLGIAPGGPGMGGAKDMGVKDSLDASVSGSREGIKNITINIGKQIESLTFMDVKDVTQAVDTVRREVERAIMAAVNQANYAS